MSSDIQDQLVSLAEEVKDCVETYWQMWHQPLKYRDLLPRYSVRLPEGARLHDLVQVLHKGQYAHVLLSQSGKRYVYPWQTGLEDDALIEQLMTMDRIAKANYRANDRARKRRKIEGIDYDDV